jgi:membrane protease YdiL (CAAX protease family)
MMDFHDDIRESLPPYAFSEETGEGIVDLPEPVGYGFIPPRLPKVPRALHAGLIFLAFLGTQMLGGLVIGMCAAFRVAASGVDFQDEAGLAEAMQPFLLEYLAYGMVPIMVGCGLVVWWLTVVTAADVIRNGEPTGVGWTGFSLSGVLTGMFLGAAVCVAFIVASATLFADFQPTTQGQLAEMGSGGGIRKILWGVVAVCCAPLVEEYLFRGIMLAGLSRSFGVPAAAVICTVVFVALHVPELIHYWPGFFGVGGMAVVAMWMRIRTKSLGPAIGVHLGYNGLLVLLASLAPLMVEV